MAFVAVDPEAARELPVAAIAEAPGQVVLAAARAEADELADPKLSGSDPALEGIPTPWGATAKSAHQAGLK